MRWSFESEQAAGAIHARADLVAYLLAHADGRRAVVELASGGATQAAVRIGDRLVGLDPPVGW